MIAANGPFHWINEQHVVTEHNISVMDFNFRICYALFDTEAILKTNELNTIDNMKKTIKLNEHELNRLIKEAINELDWKTYMNAAKKNSDVYSDYTLGDEDGERKYDRTNQFVDAARNSYRKKYNSVPETSYDSYDGHGRGHGEHNYEVSYGDDYFEPYDKDNPDDGRFIQPRTRTEFTNTYDSEYDMNFPEVNSYYDEDDDDSVFAWTRPVSHYTDDKMPEWKDVSDYTSGKAKYVKGKGWTNETRRRFANAITESVIRRIRRK